MSKELLFPSEVPALVRLAASPLIGESQRHEFYDHWRALRQRVLSESALHLASSELVAFFYGGEAYVGLLVLGNPYSLDEAALFDLRLPHEAPSEEYSFDHLGEAWRQLGAREELFVARMAQPFGQQWQFSHWPSARLALVNS